MKKKIILIIICLMLIGCGKEEEKIVENKPEVLEETITIKSDDKKMVYQDGDKYKVFDYKDDIITGYKIYIDYKTIDSAKNTLDIIKVNYSNDLDVSSVTRDAQFIVITYNDKYVKDNYTTMDNLKKSLNNLKEIK